MAHVALTFSKFGMHLLDIATPFSCLLEERHDFTNCAWHHMVHVMSFGTAGS